VARIGSPSRHPIRPAHPNIMTDRRHFLSFAGGGYHPVK
jgi:hypothetical protein